MTQQTPGASPQEAERSRFVRLLAHELRNHIAPIQNAVHLMRLKARADPGLTPVVDIVDRQLAAMTRAIDAVGDAERVMRGELALERAPADLQGIVQRAHDAVRAQLEARRQRLEIVTAPDLPPVLADQSRLVRALTALLDNASRYSPEASRIAVDVRGRDGAVEIAVSDEGSGLPADVRPHAFEFFATPHRPGHGLGLGLPLAAAVVRLHGGDIRFDAANGGTRVVVRLPSAAAGSVVGADAGSAAPRAPLPAHTKATGRRVLIADDSPAVRASLTDLLQEMGHDVRAAADGEEAVRMAQAWNPEFVLLDIHMPKLSGLAAARKLRALYPAPGMQLVMMSGDGLDDVMRRGAKDAGFDHCVDKGLAIGELTALLGQA